MPHTLAVLLGLLGALLFLLPALVMLLLVRPLLHRDERDRRGFGDLSQRESIAFVLFFLLAASRAGYWLSGMFIAGLLLLVYDVAVGLHASPPAILLALGIALLAGATFWWLFILGWGVRFWQARQTLPPLTAANAPPRLRFDTPYTLGSVTITIRTVRKRQAFYPVLVGAAPPGYRPALTWFLEIECLLHNRARTDDAIWTQLEEIVPETEGLRAPHLFYQFPPLGNDETADPDFHGPFPSSHSRFTIMVHDGVESKLFYQFDDTRPMHLVAFTLHVGRKNKTPWEERLFTIEV
jgi:hypothetical protein